MHLATRKKRHNPQILHKSVIFAQSYHSFLLPRLPVFSWFSFGKLCYSFAIPSLHFRSMERKWSEGAIALPPGKVK
jgi:hypothetical protein